MTGDVLHTDQELFSRIAEGDEAAFRVLFHRYTPKLQAGLMEIVKEPETVREIVQEVFLKAWLKRAELGGMEQPGGWLFRVASNLAVSHLRKQAVRLRWYESQQPTPISLDQGGQEMSLKELRKVLDAAIRTLPPKRREIFQLSREEGLSHDEVALRLGLSKTTVKNQLSIALKSVQAYIQDVFGVLIPICYLAEILF